MRNQHLRHEELMWGISEQLKDVLNQSHQAIFIYLDDVHKVCNTKFATLLGYSSSAEWAKVEGPVRQIFVDPESMEIMETAYQKAVKNFTASSFRMTWKKKNGDTVESSVILVPTVYAGHLFAMHYVS
jgi:hypothetical protein